MRFFEHYVVDVHGYRLAALQKHGNEDWKRRTDVSPQINRNNRTDATSSGGRPVTIADRLSHLNDSQATWKAKVQDKDSKQFTVEGKLGQCTYTFSVARVLESLSGIKCSSI